MSFATIPGQENIPIQIPTPEPIPTPIEEVVPVQQPGAQTGIYYNGRPENFDSFLQSNTSQGNFSMNNRLVFAQDSVLQLNGDNFNTDTPDKITIDIPDCMLILFYIQNTESLNLASIWARVASEIAGPTFAAINMLSNRNVARAFSQVKSIPNHPYAAFGLQTYPFILVYRQGIPRAVYNGPYNVTAIAEYALVQACNVDYTEAFNFSDGVQMEGNYSIQGHNEYIANQIQNNQQLAQQAKSTDFTSRSKRGNRGGSLFLEPENVQPVTPSTQ